MSNSNWEQETKIKGFSSCKQAARLVSISFERALTMREWFTMRVHLFNCKTCSFYRRQITALRRAFVRHHEVLDNTPDSGCDCLLPEAKDRLNNIIAKHK